MTRSGIGFDAHQLEKGIDLYIGGIKIDKADFLTDLLLFPHLLLLIMCFHLGLSVPLLQRHETTHVYLSYINLHLLNFELLKWFAVCNHTRHSYQAFCLKENQAIQIVFANY